MSDSVSEWLEDLKLGRYAEAFEENDIDLLVLPNLTSEDLREIGVRSVGHRRKILGAISNVVPQQHDEPNQVKNVAILPETTRRQVSVLFADLSGFTTLSATMDPEETHALLNRFFVAVGEVIADYGGIVDKHIGDAVMAVFGAPFAHTNDHERTLRAAVEIHYVVEKLDPPLKVHIGVASGQVVASATGGSEHSEYTVTGDSVNLASRLTDLASAGETYVSESIQRALGKSFIGKSLGEKLIDGLPEPVTVWQLDRIADLAETDRLPFVGRKVECENFKRILDRCLKEEHGAVCIVRGEAGIGKSRLLDEFDRLAREMRFETHTGVVLDFGTMTGRDTVRALTRSLLSIEQDASDLQRSKIANQAIASGKLGEHHRAFLNDLLDLDQSPDLQGFYDAMDNKLRNAGKQRTLAELVRASAQDKPVLLRVEDLHWANPILLDSAAILARLTAEEKVVLVLTTRLSGDPFRSDWRKECSDAEISSLTLEPINPDEAGELAKCFANIDSQLAMTCVEKSGGNPLLLEQLLYNVDEVGDGELPGSIQTIVQARLDALPFNERQMLQSASVLGQQFTDAAVEAISGNTFRPDMLIGQALLRRTGKEFKFAHALIRDGIYETLLRTQRKDFHTKAADYFRNSDQFLHAQHLDYAGDPEAPGAYLNAAKKQQERLRLNAALSAVERALEINSTVSPRFELNCLRGDLLQDLGQNAESIQAFETALDFADNDKDRCRVHMGLAAAMRIIERADDAFIQLEKAQSVAQANNMEIVLAEVHYQRGNLFFPLGRIGDCMAEHEASLGYARQANSLEAEAKALGGLGDANYVGGRIRSAFNQFSSCLEIARSKSLRRIEVANLPMTGLAMHFLGDPDGADMCAHDAITKATEIKDFRAQLTSHAVLLETSRRRGDYDALWQHAKNLEELANTIGARRFIPFALKSYADCKFFVEGDSAGAFELIKTAHAICEEVGAAFFGAVALGTGALAAQSATDRKWALTQAENVLAAGAVSHNYLMFYIDAMDACRAAGELDRALHYAEALEDYTANEPLEWTNFNIDRTRALVEVERGSSKSELPEILEELKVFAEERSYQPSIPDIEEALFKLRPV
ncbi:adenylate/guanylate cyclase domain-containing protein [Ruegeria arenilitoris]|uniref:adenylate/guanylate cyclase domain-containing protein n=1 Tax=Ruegeria arenilitoris TaxID=1173585 RepID=UPI00147A31B7|nr:adenylate/guanylate cyclase domain-containing protein [Ruegeria arenilitoris]